MVKKLGLVLLYYQVKKKRILQEYNKYIHPKQGFNHEIINEFKNKIKDFSDIELFMVILFDKIKVQENLAWSKYNGDLIGFDDHLADVNLNYATLRETNAILPNVLLFFFVSFFFAVLNPFRFSLAIFATNLFQFLIYRVPLRLLLLHVMWHLLIINFSAFTLA